jgi:hypothetical protein
VIEHVVNVEEYLGEIYRVLRPPRHRRFHDAERGDTARFWYEALKRVYVREYRSDELASILRSRFADVTIRGVFATEPFYAVDYSRCQKAPAIARWRRLGMP